MVRQGGASLTCWCGAACVVQLSRTAELDAVMRQCDVIDVAQVIGGHQKQPPKLQKQRGSSALDSRAEEIGRDYFHHLPQIMAQSGHTHIHTLTRSYTPGTSITNSISQCICPIPSIFMDRFRCDRCP